MITVALKHYHAEIIQKVNEKVNEADIKKDLQSLMRLII